MSSSRPATPRSCSRAITAGGSSSSTGCSACSPSRSPRWRRRRVVLGRDRLGIKPLYLAETGGALRFASTPQALIAGGGVDTSIDPVALHHYLTWHAVVPPPRTILAGVRKLEPATLMVIEPDGERRTTTYWRPSFSRDAAGDGGRDADSWREEVLEALRRAVRRRMVADVPVGVLLSGGLDSSLIVALLAEQGQRGLQTFSIGFDPVGGREGDEFVYSDRVVEEFATDHHKLPIGEGRTIAALEGAIAAMSEPMVSHDNVAFYLLSQEVSKHVKVVQSGQGADEVFAGYHWYATVAASEDRRLRRLSATRSSMATTTTSCAPSRTATASSPTSAPRSPTSTSAARAPTSRSTRRCASTPR